MNRTVRILLLSFLAMICLNLWAQQKKGNGKTDNKAQSQEPAKKILLPNVYLGHSDYKGGPIRKDDFNRLLKQGLTSRDSLGNKYRVVSFDFNYAERVLYEDSIGNLKMMTDLLFEYCPGDTVTGNVSASIYDRIKAGDTVFIDKVVVVKYASNKSTKSQPDADAIGAKGLKCVIMK